MNNLFIPSPIAVRETTLEMLYHSKAGHLGSNMSVIEMQIGMLASVDTKKIKNQSLDRSRIIISKGHCAAATYATLSHFGLIDSKLLKNYHLNGSYLTGHVSHMVDAVEHSTGALGHGINVAVGSAIGLKSRNFDGLSLALVGDGEIQEGSVWEAIMFAVHHNLNNFICLVDNNRISSIENTHDVIDMRPLKERFEGFGCNVKEVDGHSVAEIIRSIKELSIGNKPGILICYTTKGKDVPFAENKPIWHYKNLSTEEFHKALEHLKSKEEK